MIEVTQEMRLAFDAAAASAVEDDGFHFKEDATIRLDAGLAAVFAIVEPNIRERLADALEEHAIGLRGMPFRRGDVGIEFICGIEDAAERVRTGKDGAK